MTLAVCPEQFPVIGKYMCKASTEVTFEAETGSGRQAAGKSGNNGDKSA